MPDSVELTKESFIKLLAKISPENNLDGQSLAYARLYDALVRFFQMKGDTAPETAADLTFDRIAKKINDGTEINDIQSFSFGVARYMFQERLRAESKNRKAEQEFEAQRKSDSGSEKNDDLSIFRQCFNSLSPAERELLQKYFAENTAKKNERKKLAESLQLSLDNLRLRIFRLRKRLEHCIQRKLK